MVGRQVGKVWFAKLEQLYFISKFALFLDAPSHTHTQKKKTISFLTKSWRLIAAQTKLSKPRFLDTGILYTGGISPWTVVSPLPTDRGWQNWAVVGSSTPLLPPNSLQHGRSRVWIALPVYLCDRRQVRMRSIWNDPPRILDNNQLWKELSVDNIAHHPSYINLCMTLGICARQELSPNQ